MPLLWNGQREILAAIYMDRLPATNCPAKMAGLFLLDAVCRCMRLIAS